MSEDERIRITASVGLLERRGPNLPFPHSSGISGSRHSHMRELGVQVGGRPLRVFYAFDPRRTAVLLTGGDKTGRDDFYMRLIPLTDRLYDEHLAQIAAEAATRTGTMAGRHSFDRLRDSLPATARVKAGSLTDAMDRDLSLAELRRARLMTQDQLAADLNINQASVAKLERRTDMYLSTLRRFVEAMGGELEIVAWFPDQPHVRLRGIGELIGDQAAPDAV